METITLHRALSELKIIGSRIEKQISELVPLGMYQRGKLVNAGIGGYIPSTLEEFEASAKSKLQSINDLIERRNTIKKAVISKNSIVEMKVSGNRMTIADAINFKQILVYKKMLIQNLVAKQNGIISAFNRSNEVMERNLQTVLEASFGGKDNVKAKKDTPDIETITSSFRQVNELILSDPLELNKIIEQIEKEISDFETEVDAKLSEINAVTTIDI